VKAPPPTASIAAQKQEEDEFTKAMKNTTRIMP